jgi:HEAT repeat protein
MTMSQMMKATFLNGLAFAGAALISTTALASVSNHAQQSGIGTLQSTKEALELPLAERLQTLKSDSHSYENLKALMFAKGTAMDVRWKAVTAAGRVGGEKAKSDMVRALTAPEWFMRNAGLVALSNLDRTASLTWARKLLSDKALVVRAAAVDVISQSHDSLSANLLWTKLYSKENYRNHQSLFIRRRIVEVLADLDGKGHEAKFIALLQDKDDSLHEPAMEALERITKHTVGNPGEPVQFRRAQWQQWYKANRATL